MTENKINTLNLFIRGRKGLSVLKAIDQGQYADLIGKVFVDREINVAVEYSDQILELAKKLKLDVDRYEKGLKLPEMPALAAGWQYLLNVKNLLVIHDSILPRYRGFNPLVSMLLNKEPEIGATLLWANDKPDMGPIIKVETHKVEYPLKVAVALERICEIYEHLTLFILSKIRQGESFASVPQNEETASFSLWRDELDYQVDWLRTAAQIQNFIFSVSSPYLGASTFLQGQKVRILDCVVLPDRKIENRQHGKVLLLEDGCPVVVCGTGLLKITELIDDSTRGSMLPCKSLKVRFSRKILNE